MVTKVNHTHPLNVVERVEYEVYPKYSEDDPEYACLVWIGERPTYLGIYH